MGVCRNCGAAVIWVVTGAGERIPLDPPEVDAGGVAVLRGIGRVLRAGQRPLPVEATYIQHSATCPKWREK